MVWSGLVDDVSMLWRLEEIDRLGSAEERRAVVGETREIALVGWWAA